MPDDHTDTPTAAEVVQRHLARFDEGITSELADAYDATAVIEQPFLPGNERRLRGRDAIRRHFTASESAPLQLQIRNVVVHETHDPEVVIAEYDYDGRVTSTGRTFRVANIQVFRIRNGLIVASRDYHDHARIANALRNQLA